jgi:predicted nucleotide-binding protein (sugar kinase/HSP70/actin superfamily)
MNGLIKNKDNVDGIIYMSVFPCGTDSLTTELMQRKIKNIPSINLIIDEETGFEGYKTRLESFIDIINV